jgi:hypothetical protein
MYELLFSPSQIIFGCQKTFAILGVKLTVPISEQFYLFVFLRQNWIVDKFLGVPNHNVPFVHKRFYDDSDFRQSTHVSWCIKIVDNFLDQRLDGGFSVQYQNWPK